MFRILGLSVRGTHRYLEGGGMHPIDLDAPVPAGVGTEFPNLDAIKRHVPREYRGVSSIHQVQVVDRAGTVVMRGWRTGPGGTGEKWGWRESVSEGHPPTWPGYIDNR
ncbi:hypothetical protein [Micromonospora sp. NPDC005652]|uniref:hypothetical protein n=1 Tax=Micromonospora sp. NPDC005652 TaxID=3157046 RepID=UPI0033CE4B34